MNTLGITLFLLALLGVLLAGGVWIAIVLLAMGWAAMELFTSTPVGKLMATTVWGSIVGTGRSRRCRCSSGWARSCSAPGFPRTCSAASRPGSPHCPDGWMHGNVIGCAIFAAVSGSSAATAATIGKMIAPELLKRGYDERWPSARSPAPARSGC